MVEKVTLKAAWTQFILSVVLVLMTIVKVLLAGLGHKEKKDDSLPKSS